MTDVADLKEIDIIMADGSSKLRDLELRTLTAIDITFRPGAVKSLQREQVTLEEYVQPLERAANAFFSMAFWVPPFVLVSPNVRWAGVANAHAEAAKEIADQYDKLRLQGLWDEYQTQAVIIKRLEREIAAKEASVTAVTFSAVEKIAKAGLDNARALGRGVERVTGLAITSSRDVALKAGDVAQTVTSEGAATVREGIKTGGAVITKVADKAASTVQAGLIVWGIAAVAALGLVMLFLAPAIRGYIPKAGAR